MIGEDIELLARHDRGDNMLPYERLLGDAMRGDTAWFARQDSVEAAWQIVNPILKSTDPPLEYEPAAWGPPEAQRIIDADAGWRNPAPLRWPAV